MSIFIKNIKKLVNVREAAPSAPLRGEEMLSLPCLDGAWLLTEGDRISRLGRMQDLRPEELEAMERSAEEVIDAEGRMVFPSYCDSHTHLVYAGSRETEFMDKLRGLSYQEIARRGGGILNSVELLHNTPEDDLLQQTLVRAWEIISLGTGAVEIKSGYGLTVEDEVKMLRVARRVEEETPLRVRTTFLGAHAVPARYKGNREGYVDEIVREIMPAVAAEGLADYVDIFVEEGFFTVEDASRIFEAAAKYGMVPKVHANQMSFSGGVQVGVRYGAASVDHLEFTGPEEFKALQGSGTIATLLPGATFFLDMDYPKAKEMLEYDLPLAIASNYNPGSCPSGDMKFMMALAMIKMRLTLETVLNAATVNGAFAMGVASEYGSITPGKKAFLFITKKIPSYEFVPYSFTSQLIETTILNGKKY
ncbi:MAG TPA: imidazolonepropionase [Candidatus Coprenecus merdipullorum]|nr:imidazolonepropionase [Candidatus Coprenecus merdipullorum]